MSVTAIALLMVMQASPDPFDEFAAKISAPASLAAAGALLRRLETKRAVHSRVEDACCHAALRRLFPKAAKAGRKVERYPTRIVFCAYMIKVRRMLMQVWLLGHTHAPEYALQSWARAVQCVCQS